MRLRVLLSGLTFFAAALGLAWGPLMAEAHTVSDRTKPCTIVGTARNDFLMGTAGRDVICGLGGDDRISGIGGDDIVRGGPGNDVLEGGAGRDILRGGTGNDVLHGYDGMHDHLYGGPGTDRGRRDRTLDSIRGVESYPG
jgi:Ca2+-binding RTX toxin-like protein